MRKNLSILYIWLASSIVTCSTYAFEAFEIAEIYIEAEGNNKYEAKVKAHEQGMNRAIHILADRIGIDYGDIDRITYPRMKEVFTVSNTSNEAVTDHSYSATVNYKYNLSTFNKILLDFGNRVVDDKFYEYLIVPIFKQKNVLKIWDEKLQWNSSWAANRHMLDQNKLFYPKFSRDLEKMMKINNIGNLEYRDYLAAFQDLLFKKVLLVICEYFTDTQTGEAVMIVNSVIIDQKEGFKTATVELPIDNQEEIPMIIDDVIIRTINDYGKSRNNLAQLEEMLELKSDNLSAINTAIKKIILNAEVYDDQEIEIIKQKLRNVKEIDNFTVSYEHNNKYQVLIETRNTEEELAEGLYLSGLSYRIYGNLYNLIDVQEGS